MSLADDFGHALAELWIRDGLSISNPHGLAAEVATRFARGGDDAQSAARLLEQSGVRAQWNRVFREQRAQAVAARVHSHIKGRVVDVLSGDGSVCHALQMLGVAGLSATERRDDYAAYPSRLPHDVPFVPFSDAIDFRAFEADTALISTVLHHEARPIELLDRIAAAGIPRWLVVENCVTPRFSRAFHEFTDLFFNTCLNEIDVHCGEEHRTLDEWIYLLSRYGRVTVAADFFDVPGIPFPYSLLVVDRPSRNPATV